MSNDQPKLTLERWAALRGLVERLHKAAEGHAETHGERGFCAGLRSGAHLLTELIEQTDLSEDAQ